MRSEKLAMGSVASLDKRLSQTTKGRKTKDKQPSTLDFRRTMSNEPKARTSNYITTLLHYIFWAVSSER